MNLNELIMNYGYIIILIGTFFEGEAILIIAGFLAHNGYLRIELVVAAAFFGAFFSDELHFFLARYKGKEILLRRPLWEEKINRFNIYLEKYNELVILFYRFIYGIRSIASFSIGLSNISKIKFILLNALAVLIWALATGICGYFFGHTAELLFGEIQRVEKYIFIFAAVCILIFLAYKLIFKKFYRIK